MEVDPNVELHIREKHDAFRKESNDKYAVKLVEKIVFYMVGAMGIAVLGALFKLVIL